MEAPIHLQRPRRNIPDNLEWAKRLHIGKEIPVNIDSGPSGKNIAGGYMDYAKRNGGNIVFTDSMVPEIRNVPLSLTSSYLWDALALPLTTFNDSTRKGTIRTVSESDLQPYQYAIVQLRDNAGKPVIAKGKSVEFSVPTRSTFRIVRSATQDRAKSRNHQERRACRSSTRSIHTGRITIPTLPNIWLVFQRPRSISSNFTTTVTKPSS